MPVKRAARRAGALARRLACAGAALPLAARAAWAHPGRPAEPHDLWRAWSIEPVTMTLLALSAWLWIRGAREMARHAGARGLGAHGASARRVRAAAFAAGWTTLAVALLSPLHAVGGALFSAHMVQHELLAVVAAPLLVVARPLAPMLWALPPASRRRVAAWMHAPAARRLWRAVANPVSAFAIHAVALWAWHLPAAYEASLASEAAHAAQHASFLLTALLYWWAVLGARAAMGGAVLSLFGTALHTGALGALITFSGTLWYPSYAATTGAWGLMPLEDQELAGLVMWIPGGMAYLIGALALVSRLMRTSEWRAAPLDAVVHRR